MLTGHTKEVLLDRTEGMDEFAKRTKLFADAVSDSILKLGSEAGLSISLESEIRITRSPDTHEGRFTIMMKDAGVN